MHQGKGKKNTSLRFDKHVRLIPRDISESIGKMPPAAKDMEEALLGAVMIEKNAIDEVVNMLKPEDFYEERHKEIYASILDLRSEKIAIDMRSVVHQLRKNAKIELIGGAFYISELTSKVSSAANIKHNAAIIVEMSLKRQMIIFASEIHHHAYEDDQDAFELLDRLTERLEFFKKHSVPQNNEAQIKALWEKTLILSAPEEEPPLINIEDTPIVIPGNHTLVVGKKKSRKTLFIVHLISLYLKVSPLNANKVLLFDTEQGRSHVYALRLKIFQMSGLWVPVFYLRGQAPQERMDFIANTLRYWPQEAKLVVIDGIRDLMSNINDPDESTDLIVWLERLTLVHNVGVINILHLNKTDGNARGHIGSELLNKALCTIELELDEKNGCTVVKCESSRDKPFNTFAFTHGNLNLPEMVGTPVSGNIVPIDEKKRRLEAIFVDGPLKYTPLIEEIKAHFDVRNNKAGTLLADFTRQGWVMRSGKSRSPDAVYKLMTATNGIHAEPQVVQTALNLEQNYKKVEENVPMAVATDDLPF